MMRPSIVRWVYERWHLVGATLLLAYFAYHGIHGERGFIAWVEKGRELRTAEARLAQLDLRIDALAAKVAALQPDRSDPDLLEEQLRQLGYIAEGEVILLPQGPGGRH